MEASMLKYSYLLVFVLAVSCGDDQDANLSEGDACSASSDNCSGDNICIEGVCSDAYSTDYKIKVDELQIKRLDYWDGNKFRVTAHMTYGNTNNQGDQCFTTVNARLSQRGEYSSENFDPYTGGTVSGCDMSGIRSGDVLNIKVENLAFFDWDIFHCSIEIIPSTLRKREITCLGGDEGSVRFKITPQ
jgi:hypothetical protein